MDEQDIVALANGIKNVEKRLDRNVAEMCTLLEALAEEIFQNRPGLPRQDADVLRTHFHDVYKSLKLHLVFHSGADLSSFDAPTKLQGLGRSIGLNAEELQRQSDENYPFDYCADPWGKLLEIVSTHFRMVFYFLRTDLLGITGCIVVTTLYQQQVYMRVL